jgi:hypothetical protein
MGRRCTNNAFTQKKDELKPKTEYFDFTAKLFNWHKSKSNYSFGTMTHTTFQNNVYTYFRYNNNRKVMVVMNNNNESKTIKPIVLKKTSRTKQERWNSELTF